MSSNSLAKKSISRRSLMSIVGGAAGALAATKAVAAESRGSALSDSAAAEKAQAAVQAQAANAAVVAESKLQKFDSARVVDASTLPKADAAVLAGLGIRPGADIYGYKVVSVYGLYLGAIPVVLQDKTGEHFQVDVCAKDGSLMAPRAVAHAGGFSFFLANGGDGRLASHESHGLGAMAMAQYLDRQGTTGSVEGLLTLQQRNEAHPNGAYTISV